MPPPDWVTVGFMGLAIQTGRGRPPEMVEFRDSLPAASFFSLPSQRGTMNDQHFLRITPFPAEGVPPLPILGFSERASPQRKTELGLETGTCQEAQKTCCSTGRSQTAPGGPSGKGPPSTRKALLRLPPGARVHSASGKEFHPRGR